MISLKRLESMRRWLQAGGVSWSEGINAHAVWAEREGLLRIKATESHVLVPTKRLASAIAEAEAEHERHKTVERREQTRREADYRYLLHRAERGLAAQEPARRGPSPVMDAKKFNDLLDAATGLVCGIAPDRTEKYEEARRELDAEPTQGDD